MGLQCYTMPHCFLKAHAHCFLPTQQRRVLGTVTQKRGMAHPAQAWPADPHPSNTAKRLKGTGYPPATALQAVQKVCKAAHQPSLNPTPAAPRKGHVANLPNPLPGHTRVPPRLPSPSTAHTPHKRPAKQTAHSTNQPQTAPGSATCIPTHALLAAGSCPCCAASASASATTAAAAPASLDCDTSWSNASIRGSAAVAPPPEAAAVAPGPDAGLSAVWGAEPGWCWWVC